MELLEDVGVDVEEIQRRRIRQPDDLHVAEQQKEVVQLSGLKTKLALVRPVGGAMKEVSNVLPERHWPIIAGFLGFLGFLGSWGSWGSLGYMFSQ